MAALTKKIDFVGFIMVERSNPNGDPLNGNQPRTDYNGYGEISDVCLKRKVRNRLQDVGEKILVQSNERVDDGCDSIRSRVEANPAMEKPLKMKDKEQGRTRIFAEEACKAWIDVRSARCLRSKRRKSRASIPSQLVYAVPYRFIRQSV